MIIDSHISVSQLPTSITALKFALFIKSKEINTVNETLDKVLSLPKRSQAEWIANYGEMTDSALDNFVDEVNQILDKVTIDDELIEISQELIHSLRDAVEAIDNILGKDTNLVS